MRCEDKNCRISVAAISGSGASKMVPTIEVGKENEGLLDVLDPVVGEHSLHNLNISYYLISMTYCSTSLKKAYFKLEIYLKTGHCTYNTGVSAHRQ